MPTDLPFDPAAALLRPTSLSGTSAMPEAGDPAAGETFAGLLEVSHAQLAGPSGALPGLASAPLSGALPQAPEGAGEEATRSPLTAATALPINPAELAGTRLPPSGEKVPPLLPQPAKALWALPADAESLRPGTRLPHDEESPEDLPSPATTAPASPAASGTEAPDAGVAMPADTPSDRPLASVPRAIAVPVPAAERLASLADSGSDAVQVLPPRFLAGEVPPPQVAKPDHVPAANPLPDDDEAMTAGLRVLPPALGTAAVRRSARADGTAASLAAAAMPVSSPASSPAPAPLPGAAAPASAPAPSPAMVPEAGAAQGASPAAQPAGIEAAIEQLAGLRDAARAGRSDMTLRHGEFGAVTLRVEASAAVPGEWRAVVASRDPGFVPAVQAALAERAIAAAGEAASSGGLASGGNGSGSGSGQGTYGSSPGSQQGSSQPYSPQGQGERRPAARVPDRPADAARRADDPADGLFA